MEQMDVSLANYFVAKDCHSNVNDTGKGSQPIFVS